MSDPTIDVAAVIGGGVVGLAAACAVAARGPAACVIERLPRPGLEASTHNSGVVHCRHLLSAGLAEGRPLRRGTRAALRLLRRARGAVRAVAAS